MAAPCPSTCVPARRNAGSRRSSYTAAVPCAGCRSPEPCCWPSAEGAAAEPERQPPTGRIAFTDADDVAILTYVKENARSASSVTGNALWKAMEKSSQTQHSWQSLKDRYLKHLRGQEHKYLLGDAPVSPSSQKLKRKAEEDPEAADSGEPQNKRTPDLPEEEFVREEVKKENEEAVKKMLVEATREFEEVVVEESPDFEIHITMCDDDPPTPEEDSETQPDEDEEEEEEEKVSPPEVGAAIKIIRQLMEKFNLDLSTVTQAFLKNSGELEATTSFLESGQRADGYPIWSRQDDLDLQKDDEDARDTLVKKFGAQNVARRIEFRKK
uniref:Telomeric repeat-binding factor 2-interacting protein 1 n=1 Tax=Molossus molossus TaxID=27622 RepID=A0A7J8CBJ5_MOLMO|nr:TERF2 interacting protein [Molossus molossus]